MLNAPDDDLTPFIGGTIDYTIDARSLSQAVGSGNINSFFRTFGNAELTVEYKYDNSLWIKVDKEFTGYDDLDESGTISLGDILNFKHIIINDGGVVAHSAPNSVLNDRDINGNFQKLIPGDEVGGEDIELAPGDMLMTTSTYTVTQEDIDRGWYSNMAIACVEDATGERMLHVIDTETVNFNTPLDIDKTLVSCDDVNEDGAYSVGDILNYNYSLSNTGMDALSNVMLRDRDSYGVTNLTLVEGDTNGDSLLDMEETWLFQGSHVITQEDLDRNGYSNTALASARGAEGRVRAADLDMIKFDPTALPSGTPVPTIALDSALLVA